MESEGRVKENGQEGGRAVGAEELGGAVCVQRSGLVLSVARLLRFLRAQHCKQQAVGEQRARSHALSRRAPPSTLLCGRPNTAPCPRPPNGNPMATPWSPDGRPMATP